MPGQGVVLPITDPSSAQLQSPARWSGKLSELCELSLEDAFFELAPRQQAALFPSQQETPGYIPISWGPLTQ